MPHRSLKILNFLPKSTFTFLKIIEITISQPRSLAENLQVALPLNCQPLPILTVVPS